VIGGASHGSWFFCFANTDEQKKSKKNLGALLLTPAFIFDVKKFTWEMIQEIYILKEAEVGEGWARGGLVTSEGWAYYLLQRGDARAAGLRCRRGPGVPALGDAGGAGELRKVVEHCGWRAEELEE
jgi:hypothetical protein